MNYKAICVVFMVVTALFLSSCSGDVNGVPEPRSAPEGNLANGRRLIASYGCGSCHTIPGVPGANSKAGPPLKCFYQRTYIAGRLSNTKENLMQWIQHPQQIDPGNAMPDLGVSEQEASDIADYLYDPLTYWGPSDLLERKCSE
jgi:cytochrome c1